MDWFENQLKQRKDADDRRFQEVLEDVSAAVMGQSIRKAMDNKEVAKSALEEILKFYHCKYRSISFDTEISTVEEQLERQLRPYGIMHRNVELKKGWYKDAVGAMLGTMKEDGRAVVLIPGHFSGYVMMDIKHGKRIRLNRKTAQLLETDAVCFYHSLPQRELKIPDLLLFMLHEIPGSAIVGYLGIMALITLAGMMAPKFTKLLTGDMITYGNGSALIALAVFMLLFQLCKVLLSIYQTLYQSKIQVVLNQSLQAAVISRILSLPASFFQDCSSGELAQRSSYLQALCSVIMSSVANVGISSLFSLVYIAQVVSYAPALVVPSLSITVLSIAFELFVTFYQMKITKKQMETNSKLSGMTFSTITGIQKIKLAGAEKRMFSRWAEKYAEVAQLTYNPPMVLKIHTVLSTLITLSGTMILYYIAIRTKVELSDYYAFNTAYAMVAAAISSVGSLADVFARIKPMLEMAGPILDACPESAENKQSVTELKGNIEISHLSFRYREDMPYVINDLSLKIRKGEYLAVVGSTGCGKSTLVRLLLGFEKPEKGTVFFDRYELSKVDLRSLRRKIGVVMQNGSLFSGDIYSNIVISAPQLSMDDAWRAAEMAGLADDIRKMPMEMLTLISEGQGGISGGQKQRMMIARALAPKPRILILDEATSALDNITQKHVSDAIDSLKCTRIVIAHRLSTIRHADRIIYLENGTIAEEGTYEELVEKNGKFAELIERQRLDVDVD